MELVGDREAVVEEALEPMEATGGSSSSSELLLRLLPLLQQLLLAIVDKEAFCAADKGIGRPTLVDVAVVVAVVSVPLN